jgi:hypothetical protein
MGGDLLSQNNYCSFFSVHYGYDMVWHTKKWQLMPGYRREGSENNPGMTGRLYGGWDWGSGGYVWNCNKWHKFS